MISSAESLEWQSHKKREREGKKSTKVKQEHLYWAVHGQLLSRCSWDTQEISGGSDVETSRHRFNAEDKMHGVDSINARWWNSSVSSLAFIFAVIPTIQHGPQVFSTIEGTPISLPCRAAGVPAPDITWTKVCISSLETAKKKKPGLFKCCQIIFSATHREAIWHRDERHN